ncbi:MAG: hypothetical protein R3F39_22690 [Myxococcota bacterium]
MFRLLLSLLFLVVAALGALGVHLGIEKATQPLDQDTDARVQASGPVYERSQRLRELVLSDFAQAVASSEVGAYLDVLASERARMLKIEADAYAAHPGAPEGGAAYEARKGWISAQTEFLDALSTRLAERIEQRMGVEYWVAHPREAFLKQFTDTVAACNATSVSTCFFRLSFYPLETAVKRLTAEGAGRVKPDMVVVTDDRGTGIADVDKPKWSDDTRFSERYPLIRGAREGARARDIVQRDGGNSYYFVVAAPVMAGANFSGTVLVGVEIDDGFIRDESWALGYEVSYLDGSKLIRSTLNAEDQKEILHNIPPRSEKAAPTFFAGADLAAQFVPVTGNYSSGDIKVVLARPRGPIQHATGTAQLYVWLYAALMFFVASGLLYWLARTHTRPLVAIDSGLHEVMNGNQDYEFNSGSSDPLWTSFAGSLNRMVGILRGGSIEEDELDAYLGVHHAGDKSDDKPIGDSDEG